MFTMVNTFLYFGRRNAFVTCHSQTRRSDGRRTNNELMNLVARLGLGRRNQGAVLARLVRDELRWLDFERGHL